MTTAAATAVAVAVAVAIKTVENVSIWKSELTSSLNQFTCAGFLFDLKFSKIEGHKDIYNCVYQLNVSLESLFRIDKKQKFAANKKPIA